MAAITWNDVVAHVSGLTGAAVSTTAQADILSLVNTTLNVTGWGGETSPRLKLARVYLAAHYGTLAAEGAFGPAGPAKEEEVGDLRVVYAVPALTGGDPLLDTTAFGRAYRALARNTPKLRAPCVI